MARNLTPANRRTPVSAERVFVPGVAPLNAVPVATVRTLPGDVPDEAAIVSASIRTAAALRAVRDNKTFLSEARTFREWCMNKFGERLGAFLDETL